MIYSGSQFVTGDVTQHDDQVRSEPISNDRNEECGQHENEAALGTREVKIGKESSNHE
ncbi:hypothetical protein SDC9_164454 [bioreactor metagenome]|uniref:Uncharacterized protein n=1 Tax=bioreactor metagenome TaxID=1076179 RepID=A0A645FZ06_9ZZZZ